MMRYGIRRKGVGWPAAERHLVGDPRLAAIIRHNTL